MLANFLTDADAAVSFGEVSARIGSGLYGWSEFDDWTDVPSGCCTDAEADLLRPAVYRAHAAQPAPAGRALFCRIYDAFLGNGAAEPLFPDDVTVGASYLVRNPLDVAVSRVHYAGHGEVGQSVAMLNDPRAAHHRQVRRRGGGRRTGLHGCRGGPVLRPEGDRHRNVATHRRGGCLETVGALTKALCEEFEVDEETCLHDVGVLLDEMAAADLIELASQDSDAAGTAG